VEATKQKEEKRKKPKPKEHELLFFRLFDGKIGIFHLIHKDNAPVPLELHARRIVHYRIPTRLLYTPHTILVSSTVFW
jgi:hypothetical protein